MQVQSTSALHLTAPYLTVKSLILLLFFNKFMNSQHPLRKQQFYSVTWETDPEGPQTFGSGQHGSKDTSMVLQGFAHLQQALTVTSYHQSCQTIKCFLQKRLSASASDSSALREDDYLGIIADLIHFPVSMTC